MQKTRRSRPVLNKASANAVAAATAGKRRPAPCAFRADNPRGKERTKVKNGGIVDEKGIAACAPVRRAHLYSAAGRAVFSIREKRRKRLRYSSRTVRLRAAGNGRYASAISAADDAEPPLLILDENTGEVAEVSVRDFVRGAVAAEMPMTYPDEALRAQAVAAHSYALAVKAQADPDNEALKGAYFSANPTQRLGYITDTVMRAMWGEDYEANRTRLYTVVDSVLDEILLYDGQPAMACYHAISGGKTEAAEAVWGAAVPYLVSVDSPLDLTSPDYEQTITVTKQEVAEDIAAAFPDIVLEGDAAGWFGTPQLTAAGYVDSITIGGVPCKGTAVRAALRLRSASFTITWTEKHLFEITTRGYGHGVGLSQYGANALALTGKSYQEILSLYYPGTTLGPAPR